MAPFAPHPSQHTLPVVIPTEVRRYLTVGLICTFLVIGDVEHCKRLFTMIKWDVSQGAEMVRHTQANRCDTQHQQNEAPKPYDPIDAW